MVALNETRRSRPSRAAYARLPRENPPPPRSCSAPRSPSVQRARYYDPSTGEFTSRDPLEYVDGMSAFRNYLSQHGRDPSGKIEITKIRRFFSDDGAGCGDSHFITWDFALSFDAPCDGYIVQKVTLRRRVDMDCVDCPDFVPTKPDKIWWEAWWVLESDQLPEVRLRPTARSAQFESVDESTTEHRQGTCGVRVVTGEIRFYCKDAIDGFGNIGTGDLGKEGEEPTDPNSEWGLGSSNGVPEAGGLPTFVDPTGAGKQPPFWRHDPVEGPEFRGASHYWKCCGECQLSLSHSFYYPIHGDK
jgi:hypothetical protein